VVSMTDNPQDGNDVNVGPSVISLELTEEIQYAQLVTKLDCSYGSKSVIIELNHKYDNKKIEYYPIDTGEDKWIPTLDTLVKTLKERGVSEEDSIKIRRLLNHNSEKIARHFAEQKLARMTAGQKAKMERAERLRTGTPIELSIKDALRMHEGLVRVKGMINGLGMVEKMSKARGFRCCECDSINVKFDYTNSRPRFEEEIPRFNISRMKCVCQKDLDADEDGPFVHEPWDDPVNALKIPLLDTETFNDLESLNVVLDDYTRDVITGDQITATGSIHRVSIRGKTLSYLFVGVNSIKGVTNVLEYTDRKELVELTSEDEKNIREFLEQNKGRELEALAEKMAPSIIGEEHVNLQCS
jgi:hypothetical protein